MEEILETIHVRLYGPASKILSIVHVVCASKLLFSTLRSIGTLSCSSDCTFDTSQCQPLAVSLATSCPITMSAISSEFSYQLSYHNVGH